MIHIDTDIMMGRVSAVGGQDTY